MQNWLPYSSYCWAVLSRTMAQTLQKIFFFCIVQLLVLFHANIYVILFLYNAIPINGTVPSFLKHGVVQVVDFDSLILMGFVSI